MPTVGCHEKKKKMKESEFNQIEKELGKPYNGASWLYLKSGVKDIIDANEIFRDGFEDERFSYKKPFIRISEYPKRK